MKVYPECYGCIFKQAVTAVTTNDIDLETQMQALQNVLLTLANIDDNLTPSEIAGETNRVIRETVGIKDLYQEDKKTSHSKALSYLDDLRTLATQNSDILEQGLKISAAGNIIDVIHTSDYDLWDEVEKSVQQHLQGEGLESFRKRISESSSILYLADNVGETIFDRVFIETLNIPVTYAVKSGPVLNDATLEDALAAGIDQVAEVVETGSWAPGTVLHQCSDEFQQLFEQSTLVISKGQANYETMDEQGEKVFFLLRIKCPVLSRKIGAPFGSLVLKQGDPLN